MPVANEILCSCLSVSASASLYYVSCRCSSSVATPIDRKEIEARDVNEEAASDLSRTSLLCFSSFCNNCFAPWAFCPSPQLELDLGHRLSQTPPPGSVCGKTSPSRGQIALSTVESCSSELLLRVWSLEHIVPPPSTAGVRRTALASGTNLVLSKGTGPRGAARAGWDVLHALLVSFAVGRAVRELEAQLEYERVRREKLESQLDEYRAEISHLRKRLEKTCIPPAFPVVSATQMPQVDGTETAAQGLCMFVLPKIPRHHVRK